MLLHLTRCSTSTSGVQVRGRLPCETVLLVPTPQAKASPGRRPERLTFATPLKLQPSPSLGHSAWTLDGTAADCILAAVDQRAGLLQHLGLTPVLSLVGLCRGAALGPEACTSDAVAVARHSAVLGVPAVAASLASTSLQVTKANVQSSVLHVIEF